MILDRVTKKFMESWGVPQKKIKGKINYFLYLSSNRRKRWSLTGTLNDFTIFLNWLPSMNPVLQKERLKFILLRLFVFKKKNERTYVSYHFTIDTETHIWGLHTCHS